MPEEWPDAVLGEGEAKNFDWPLVDSGTELEVATQDTVAHAVITRHASQVTMDNREEFVDRYEEHRVSLALTLTLTLTW